MKKSIFIKLSLLYSSLVGCGNDDSGCTDWSSYQNKTLSAVPSLHEKSASVSDDVLPLKLQMQSPSVLVIGSSTRSTLNLNVPITAEKNSEKIHNFNSQNLALKGDTLVVKDILNAEVYREGFPYDAMVKGWSFADDILVYDSALAAGRQTTMLDLRVDPPVKHDVASALGLRFLNDGRYTLSTSSGLQVYSNQFEHLKDYSSVVNVQNVGQQSYNSDIRVTESDTAGHETNRWETRRSAYDSVPYSYCIKADGSEITASSGTQLNLSTGVFRDIDSYSNSCSSESALSPSNTTRHFFGSIEKGSENWDVEVKITVKSYDFENQKFDWDCTEKNFIIGEMAYDYEVNMTNSHSEFVREHGSATFRMDKPTCTGSYSGG